MLNLVTDWLPYWFPGGRTLKLVKNGVNITNSTNPLSVVKNVTLTVVDYCAPPPIRLVAHGGCVNSGIHYESESCYNWFSYSFN